MHECKGAKTIGRCTYEAVDLLSGGLTTIHSPLKVGMAIVHKAKKRRPFAGIMPANGCLLMGCEDEAKV